MKNKRIQYNVRGFISAIAMLSAIWFFNSVVYAQPPDYTLSIRAGGTDWKKSDLLSKKELRNNLYNDMFPMRLKDSCDNLEPMDTGDAENVELVSRWANGPCYAVAAKGDTAYFGNGGYLDIVDFSDPANPIELGKVLVPGHVEGVAVNGGYTYVVNEYDGLHVIDVSDPSNPFEVGYFDTGHNAYSVAMSESYAYVGGDGLHVIDVSDPTNPFEVVVLIRVR